MKTMKISMKENIGILIGQLDWICFCGSVNTISFNNKEGGFRDLDCRHCGLVGSVSVRPKDLILPPLIKE
jgi:hypothetical protein